MPVSVAPREGKYRIIEPDGSIATTPQGRPRDGGGHSSREKALRQMRAINSSLKGSSKASETLYIHRPLLNGAVLIQWAVSQGFTTIIPVHDLHVTIAYSKKKLNWSSIPQDHSRVTIIGGHRSVEKLGDHGAIVLRFKSKELEDRWQEIKDRGGSWDWDIFRPHVTLTYTEPKNIDIDLIEPYEGVLNFGAEVWAKVDLDETWRDDLHELKI